MDINKSIPDLEKEVYDLQQKLKVLEEIGLPLYKKDDFLKEEFKNLKKMGIELYKEERKKDMNKPKPVWNWGGGATMDL